MHVLMCVCGVCVCRGVYVNILSWSTLSCLCDVRTNSVIHLNILAIISQVSFGVHICSSV